MDVLLTILALLILGYIVLYIGGNKYLETFQNQTQQLNDTPVPEKPYATMPINDIDEYEISAVFQNQGTKEASQKQISDAMTRYPMDWSAQGPNSQYFQENQAQYEKQLTMTGDQSQASQAIDEILDVTHQDAEEKKILQTYKPKSSKHLLHYSVQDVKTLLHKVYDKKGLIPVVQKSKQGENVWEIVEVKEKNPTIVWETPVQNENDISHIKRSRGEEAIIIPTTASDLAAGMDPFFQPKHSARKGKHDIYTEFTPGLERMFAPTHPVKSWF